MMLNDLKEIVKGIEARPELLAALSRIEADNSIFLKDEGRERGIQYSGSERMLAVKPTL